MGILRAIKDLITSVKAKTDNLPASPAPASEYDTQLDANMSTRAPANEYDTQLDANMSTRAPASEYDTELDANMSTRAPASEYDTEMARITADVATEAKQDQIHGFIGTEYVNGDGIPEIDNIRAHIYKTGGMGGGTVSKTISYDGSVSYAAFTVTGLVAIRIIGYITEILTNHADETKVGTTTDDDGFIVATGGAAMQTAFDIWIDATPAKFKSTLPAPSLIGDGEDVAVIGTANLITGTVVLYAIWTPISANGNVVAV